MKWLSQNPETFPEGTCYWCGTNCDGCLELTESTQMSPSDPAYFLLTDGHTSSTTVYSPYCYICKDPEFAQMGLPLCKPCYKCGGHVAADDEICDDREITQNPYHSEDEDYVRELLGEEHVVKLQKWKEENGQKEIST